MRQGANGGFRTENLCDLSYGGREGLFSVLFQTCLFNHFHSHLFTQPAKGMPSNISLFEITKNGDYVTNITRCAEPTTESCPRLSVSLSQQHNELTVKPNAAVTRGGT